MSRLEASRNVLCPNPPSLDRALPYHIGNGWFGGMLPLTAAAMLAANSKIYAGLWYPVIVAAATFVIGMLFIRETKNHKIHTS